MHLWLLTLGTAGIGVAAVLGKVVYIILAIRVPKDKITEYAAAITPLPGPEPPDSKADPPTPDLPADAIPGGTARLAWYRIRVQLSQLLRSVR
jgi:hypothetical protein